MRTGTAIFLALFMAFAPAAFACSSHGSAAATNVNGWMNSNGMHHVTGDQQDVEGNNDGENSGWAANDWYTVTITAPGNPSTSVTFTANPLDFTGGAEVEAWLEESVKDWLIDHIPDQKLADFVG
jgi:hypothetical protein